MNWRKPAAKRGSRRRAEERNERSEIGGRKPIAVEVEAGKIYRLCACRRSKHQAFRDGAHKVTAFEPIEYRAEKKARYASAHASAAGKKPLCDGSHKKL